MHTACYYKSTYFIIKNTKLFMAIYEKGTAPAREAAL